MKKELVQLREKSVDELKDELFSLTKGLFNLRLQKKLGADKVKTHLFSANKKTIARVKMILLEKGVRV